MLKIIIVFAIAFLLQAIASMAQMKYFAKEFTEYRKQGKVVCGRQAGGFHAGAIVLFLIDDNGIIKKAKKLEGVTCLARFRELEGFQGKYVGELSGEEVPKTHKNLRKAVRDASLTYCKYVSGEEIENPPTPFQRAGRSVTGFMQRKKALQ
ncbi:MAG: transcriptional regulator [Dorea sp.]|jgi:glucitol operon activator protein|nr:transcriptional regulator [Dorea sp.]